jgi:transcriptional regulator GlxA family with amidase domain
VADGYRSCFWHGGHLSRASFEAARVRVAVLALEQASLATISTVVEDLEAVNRLPDAPGAPPRFAPRVVGRADLAPLTLSGLASPRNADLDDEIYDAVVVPSLFDDGTLSDPHSGPILRPVEAAWLLRQHAAGAMFTTMCTGTFALAEAGLLDGQSGAVHWLYKDAFAARYPDVHVLSRRPLVVSGARREFVTGGASVYSSDVSLFNITRFFGAAVAMNFALLYGKTWSDALYEPPPEDVNRGDEEDRIVALAKKFFRDHLAEPGLVAAAADLANLGERALSRRFSRATGASPRAFIVEMRMERARDLLARSRLPIEEVAARVGYADRATFSKAFKERTGLSPSVFRRRLQAPQGLKALRRHEETGKKRAAILRGQNNRENDPVEKNKVRSSLVGGQEGRQRQDRGVPAWALYVHRITARSTFPCAGRSVIFRLNPRLGGGCPGGCDGAGDYQETGAGAFRPLRGDRGRAGQILRRARALSASGEERRPAMGPAHHHSRQAM